MLLVEGLKPELEGEHEGSKNSLSCIGMSHVAMCAHVVMNEEHDCGGGDKECVVSPQFFY